MRREPSPAGPDATSASSTGTSAAASRPDGAGSEAAIALGRCARKVLAIEASLSECGLPDASHRCSAYTRCMPLRWPWYRLKALIAALVLVTASLSVAIFISSVASLKAGRNEYSVAGWETRQFA